MLCSILASISFGCLLIVPATNQHKEQMKEDKIRLVCGIKNTSLEFCGGQQCEKFNMFQIDNHTTITCLFTCELGDASSNTCMYVTGPRNVLQCLDTNNNSDSYYLSIELDSRQLTEMKLDRATCGFFAVLSLHNSESYVLSDTHCNENKTLLCQAQCPLIINKDACKTSNNSPRYLLTFWIFGFVYLISNVFNAPTSKLIDALTYNHLGEERGKFGTQRVWGTIGYICFGVAAGFAMDAVKEKTEEINYSWCFAFYILHNLLATLSIKFYKTSDNVICSQAIKELGRLLQNPQVYIIIYS